MAKNEKAPSTKRNVLHVSKSVKIQATLAAMQTGVSKRSLILALGNAEDEYKRSGRLVLAKGSKNDSE
jgi:hypothetical protein